MSYCAVTQDLNDYYFNLEELEHKYLLSLPKRRDAVVDRAVSIMEQDVDSDTFHWAFSSLYNSDEDEYDSEAMKLLDIYYEGDDLHNFIDNKGLRKLAMLALEAASQIVYDVDLDELVDNGKQLSNLIDRVLVRDI